VPVVFDPDGFTFEIGKARLVRAGGDVGFISAGFMTERAIDAAATLEAKGISAGVLHVPSIKPFDAAAVADFARGVGRIVTAENHVVSGGLASLVAETLFEHGIVRPLTRIGLPDRYIECGAVPTLQTRYRLTTADLVSAASGETT
jgi:transketolase